jgi:CPA2 family monovalent cation:H+ antiporter-2
MEHEVLQSLVVVFGVSALTVFVLHRARIPSLVGFIVSGIVIGPNALGLISDMGVIETLAEIGVVLLLFTVGIEFSIERISRMKHAIVIGGGAQVAFAVLTTTIVAYPFLGSIPHSVFIGFLIALSSTAIVLKMLLEHGTATTPAGRAMVGILIFQDLCVVPFMLLVPVLSGEIVHPSVIVYTVLKTAIIIASVIFAARWLVPRILHGVVSTRSRELFIFTVILLCLGVALLTARAGLSLALGAFLAGLIISESEYAYQATADILPFKDSFMGLFFVSVGMLIDVRYMAGHLPLVLGAVAIVAVGKTVTTMGSLVMVGTPLRVAFHSALGVAQVGEFSFILAGAGKAAGLVSPEFFQLFLSAAVVLMCLTPFALGAAPRLSAWLMSGHAMRRLDGIAHDEHMHQGSSLAGHVVIVGFGVNGRNLALTLKAQAIPYCVLELNGATVIEEKKKGEPIAFGDGTSPEVLDKLGITRARLLVVGIADAAATRQIVAHARHMNPALHIIVRTRYVAEIEDLIALGANDVIPEEFETSIEIFSLVLDHYAIPRNLIADHIREVRSNGYSALRSQKLPRGTLGDRGDILNEVETAAFSVKPGNPVAAGVTLGQMHLRSLTGATIIAIKRGEVIHPSPPADFLINEHDILLLAGTREDVDRAFNYLEPT